jgi:chromate reductase
VSDTVRVLAISGSLRAGSVNRLLLRAAEEEAPIGVEIVAWDGLREIPAYDEDIETPAPAPVTAFRTALVDADAVLIATPEYNGSIPGALKNALDWASRPAGASALTAKPVAVMGASPSPFGAAWAQAELRKSLGIAGARALEQGASLGKAGTRLDADGRLTDDDPAREELRLVLDALVEAARDTAAVTA